MKIKFTAKNPHMYEVALKPFPASQALPDWWKNMTPYHKSPDNPDGKKLIVEGRTSNATFKKCTPMLDSLTSGYIIPLWSDVQVRQIHGEARFTWRVRPDVFEPHGAPSRYITPPTGYSSQVVKFINPWIPKTPKGYSVMVSQPFGYLDNPLYAVPAIIDSDTSTLEIVPPMWVKEGFEGIIEKGTPMIQITPFKRESWSSEFDFYKDGEIEAIEDRNFNSTIVSHYIKNHWSKKTYK
jgi:hypothetical protein